MTVPSTLHGTEVERVRAWLLELGVTIPEPAMVAVFPNEPDPDDQCWVQPDTATVDDLAECVVHMVRQCDATYPGRRNWRRWKATRRLATFLYVSGITGSGGSTGWCGDDPIATNIHQLPGLRSLRYRRPYLLWLPRWWWECQVRQGVTFRRHRPLEPFGFGICAACVPCPTCGQAYDCEPTCPEVAG